MLQPSSEYDYPHQLTDVVYDQVFESDIPRQVPDHEPLLIDALNPVRYLTFEDLKRNVCSVAAALRGPSFKLKEGDVVAICSENDIELVTAIHGTIAAGCTALMAPAILSDDEIEAIFENASPKLLIVHVHVLSRFNAGAGGDGLRFKLPIVAIGGDARDALDGSSRSYQHLSDYYKNPSPPRPAPVQPDTSAYIICTSGSTGPRKLIDITNRISTFRIYDMFHHLEQAKFSPNAVALSSSSFSFIFSHMFNVHMYVQHGIRQYVLPTEDLEALLGAIETHRVTITALLPPKHLGTLARNPAMAEKYDLSCLETVRCGGQMLGDSTLRAASKALGVDIQNVFGASEISGVMHSDKSGCRFPSFNGKVRLHDDRFMVKLVDDRGQPVPKGALGELWVKSPAVARGYLNNPKKTAEAFDADGFYHTQDIFFFDDNGDYVIQGRKSDIIKTAEKYYSPAPIVDICLSFGGIAQCVVVGAYDPSLGYEVPRAYIVPHNLEEFPLSRIEEFVQYVNEHVPDQAMVLAGGAKVLPMLPHTASNKLDMFKLRALAQTELEEMKSLLVEVHERT